MSRVLASQTLGDLVPVLDCGACPVLPFMFVSATKLTKSKYLTLISSPLNPPDKQQGPERY